MTSDEEELKLAIRHRIDQRIGVSAHSRWFKWELRRFIRVAAVALIGVSVTIGTYLLWIRFREPEQKLAQQQEEVLPGSEKALLTLSDGSVISLEDVPSGRIADQGDVHIEKDATGNIRYDVGNDSEIAGTKINTVTTPNGGQFRVTLPDGSTALLNAASSISYPAKFTGRERRIKMTGEVYFEVRKMSLAAGRGHMPFFVETAGQLVQVLGTHFNINAYTDEKAIKTTLVEGSVKVKAANGQSALLRPGEQSVLAQKLSVEQTDIQQQLSWINGDFIFQGADLESVLRQVARWYDVKAEYPAHIGKLRFNGMISRSQPLSVIARMIQATTKAKVTIKERRFVVTD